MSIASSDATRSREALGESPPKSMIDRLRARVGFGGLIALAFLIVVALAALLAEVVAPHDPADQDLSAVFAGFSASHPLGTDELGRDLASRLIWGARTSLLGPVIVVTIGVVMGVPLGIVAAWRGGAVDFLLSRFFDIMLAFPGILLAALAVALVEPGLATVSVALGVAYMPLIARITRGAALRERGKPYIAACEVQGVSARAICARHLLPNVAPIVVAQATILFGYAIVDVAGLSFLGFGVQPPNADWGLMVNSQDAVLSGDLQGPLMAGVLIVGCVVAVSQIGNRLGGDLTESRR